MDEYSLNPAGDELDPEAPETPEDVAVLYTWANVHGGKYRDFSASRREFRAQQRHRMVEQQRQAELDAARAREEAAAQEMEQVQRLEEQAQHDEALKSEAEEARRRAEEHIEQERQAAQQHVEAAEALKRALAEAQREMEEARRRAEEQAARYAEADARYRASARGAAIPGEIEDPYYYAGPLEPTAFAPGRGVRSSVPQRVSSEKRIAETYYRSKGASDVHSRSEDDNRARNHTEARGRESAADRESYRDMPPASQVRRDTPHTFSEPRPETPTDLRERRRPDEAERLHGTVDERYGDREDDGYYDHVPVSRPRSSDATALNSAPSNAFLAPRVQQPRSAAPPSREESPSREDRWTASDIPSQQDTRRLGEANASDDRRLASSQDPLPGSPHSLDQIRARRRESSAADVQARTTRRPRESGVTPASPTSDDPRTRRAEEMSTESYSRPEWLAREASSSPRSEMGGERSVPQREQAPLENRDDPYRRNANMADGRHARHSEARMIPAADGGFNLPPMGDRNQAATSRDLPPVRERGSYLEDRRDVPAEPPVQERNTRPELPPIVLTAAPGTPPPSRPSAERRRSDRSTGGRLGRDLRAPSVDLPDLAPEYASARTPQQPEQPHGVRPAFLNARPADSLQQSRERVAARWFALKGLMGNSGETTADTGASRTAQRDIPLPILAVVSLAGGVGKTSMVATMGRVLSSMGEVVLLADATPHGLLPYYFGARELRPDVVRTFSPPPGSRDATVFMVNYEADRLSNDEAGQTALIEELGRHVKGAQRLLMDLNGTSAWMARRLAGMNSTILVPLAADMNSVLSIKSVERYFAGLKDAEGKPLQPVYILNQFDASLPLHLDVREVLRQQLGDRLLPVTIRRSPSVAEALAEGMTVMDYAPESPVTEDYLQLAEWVRKRSAPAQIAPRSTRWSER